VAFQQAAGGTAQAFAIGDSSGNLSINIKGSGAAVTTHTLAIGAPAVAKCRQFNPPFAVGANKYTYVCWSISGAGTTVQANGTNGAAPTALGTSLALGTDLDDVLVVAPAEFK
jgi:hypothetical protein